MRDILAQRIVDRFLARFADSSRQRARELTTPINKPKGIEKALVKDYGKSDCDVEESVVPNRKDIRPEDVFTGTPDDLGVLNLVETGKDLQKALGKQVPKDKGYDAVSNLSQYLIRTEGGGGAKPVG